MLTECYSENERNRKKGKVRESSEAGKPIINLNYMTSLTDKDSDGKRGVRDRMYDFNHFEQRIIPLNSNEGGAGLKLHLNCLNCMAGAAQMNEKFDEFSQNIAISVLLAAAS